MAKVIKAKRSKFTTLSNTVLEDTRLFWGSRGVFGYMYAQADNWQFHTNELVNHSEKEGIKKLRTYLNELEHYGYLKRVQDKQSNGKFGYYNWLISDVPMLVSPESPYGEAVNGEAVNGKAVNGTLTNTNRTNTNKTKDDDEQVINTNVIKAFNENSLQNQNEYSAVVTQRLLPLVKSVESVKELNAMFDDALKDAIDKAHAGKVHKPVSYAIVSVQNAVNSGVMDCEHFTKFTQAESSILDNEAIPEIMTDIDLKNLDLSQLEKEVPNNG